MCVCVWSCSSYPCVTSNICCSRVSFFWMCRYQHVCRQQICALARSCGMWKLALIRRKKEHKMWTQNIEYSWHIKSGPTQGTLVHMRESGTHTHKHTHLTLSKRRGWWDGKKNNYMHFSMIASYWGQSPNRAISSDYTSQWTIKPRIHHTTNTHTHLAHAFMDSFSPYHRHHNLQAHFVQYTLLNQITHSSHHFFIWH